MAPVPRAPQDGVKDYFALFAAAEDLGHPELIETTVRALLEQLAQR